MISKGQTICGGTYTILGELDSGAFGTVYKGKLLCANSNFFSAKAKERRSLRSESGKCVLFTKCE